MDSNAKSGQEGKSLKRGWQIGQLTAQQIQDLSLWVQRLDYKRVKEEEVEGGRKAEQYTATTQRPLAPLLWVLNILFEVIDGI